MKKEQLCWDCKNASPLRCCWFSDEKYPQGCIVDSDNFIVECKYFIEQEKIKTDEQKAKELNISLRTYFRWKQKAKTSQRYANKLKGLQK